MMTPAFYLLWQYPDQEPEVIDSAASEAEARRWLSTVELQLRRAFRVEADELEVRATNPVTMDLECRCWAQARVDVYV